MSAKRKSPPRKTLDAAYERIMELQREANNLLGRVEQRDLLLSRLGWSIKITDGRYVDAICRHGLQHPFNVLTVPANQVMEHGCDGCCESLRKGPQTWSSGVCRCGHVPSWHDTLYKCGYPDCRCADLVIALRPESVALIHRSALADQSELRELRARAERAEGRLIQTENEAAARQQRILKLETELQRIIGGGLHKALWEIRLIADRALSQGVVPMPVGEPR